MAGIGESLAAIRERMAAACKACGRGREEVRLLAVSKTFPAAAVREAWGAGQVDFGESRQQEAAEKIATLPPGIRWHFIGRLQRNKVRKVLEGFDLIHSIDSLKLAVHVDRIAGETGRRPQALLEVNLAGEENKGGFTSTRVIVELESLVRLEHLDLRGVMVIPPEAEDTDETRRWFAQARELRDRLEGQAGIRLPELSMGMSADFEIAIEQGSTMIRVGSAIFGGRSYPI